MLSKDIFSKPAKFLASAMALGVVTLGISVSVPTAAHADFGGGGSDISVGSSAGTGGNTSQPPANYGDGNYTSTPSGGKATVSDGSQWLYVWGTSGGCAPDANGEASIGVAHHIKWEEATTINQDTPPDGYGWNFSAYFPSYGAYWTRMLSLSDIICVYKPQASVVSDPMMCVLSTSAILDRVRPTTARIGTGYATSGYAVGSQDMQACKDSQTSVSIGANLDQYSIVEGQAVSKAVWTTWRTYPGTDPRTGAPFTPTLASTSGVFDVNPSRDSISFACYGKSHPADYSIGDFTDEPCSPHRSKTPTTQCNASPILFDLKPSYGTVEDMRSVPTDSVVYNTNSIANPGRKLIFGQNPSGSGITMDPNGYRTKYTTNTPYTTLDIVRKSGDQENVLVDTHKDSGWFTGKQNTVKMQFQGALNADAPIKLSQILGWSGWRTTSGAGNFSINPITGKMSYSDTTVTVPTSGSCVDIATIGVDRAIGDIVPQ